MAKTVPVDFQSPVHDLMGTAKDDFSGNLDTVAAMEPEQQT
jgi:hypothetical protein